MLSRRQLQGFVGWRASQVSVANEFHIRVNMILALSHEGNQGFQRFFGRCVFALRKDRFKFLDEYGQVILIEGRITVFVDEPKAASAVQLVGMIHVLPWIEPTGTLLQDFSAFAFPENIYGHEIQQPSNYILSS
jgi:hypothetical protein